MSEGQGALDHKLGLVPGPWARRDRKVAGALSPETGLAGQGLPGSSDERQSG